MNNDDHALDDIISRHFDDATSAMERAALADHLISDPDAVLQFIRTARVHSLLEGIAPPRTAGRSRIFRRWASLGVAAAIVAGCAGAAVYFFNKPNASGIRQRIVVESEEQRVDRKPLPPGVNLRTVKNFVAGTTVPPASLDFLLSNFYVHANPNGLRVPEALRDLERAIREANLLNRRELATLKFTAGASLIPPATMPDGTLSRLSFKHGGSYYEVDPVIYSPLRSPFTIRDYLNVCGLYREVTQEPGGQRYAAAPAAIAPDEDTPLKSRLMTRTFRVNPGIFRHRFAVEPNPFLLVGVEPNDLRQGLMSQFGVNLASSEVLGFTDDLEAFSVNSSEAKLDRIQQILDACSQRKTVHHDITTKFILCSPKQLPRGFDPNTGILLNDIEFQTFCSLQSMGGDVANGRSIIVRAGQAAAIELMREAPGRPPVEPIQTDWFGLRQELLATCVGETIQVSGLVDVGLPAVPGLVPITEIVRNNSAFINCEDEEITHYRTGFDLWVPDRYTAIFTLDVETGNDRVALACVTVRVVDPEAE